jgi:hypothetical protein
MQPEIEIHEVEATPHYLGRVWAKFSLLQPLFSPACRRTLDQFVEVGLDQGTRLFEIGDFYGVGVIVGIPDAASDGERNCFVHVYRWDSAAIHIDNLLRQFLLEMMKTMNIHRVFSEFQANDASTPASIEASEAIGFRRVGLLRGRIAADGKPYDMLLYDALTTDLEV